MGLLKHLRAMEYAINEMQREDKTSMINKIWLYMVGGQYMSQNMERQVGCNLNFEDIAHEERNPYESLIHMGKKSIVRVESYKYGDVWPIKVSEATIMRT